MADVVIQRVKTNLGDRIAVIAPYHPDFPPQARRLGGNFGKAFGKPAWFFDPRDEKRVYELVKSVYGVTGEEDESDVVDVVLDLGAFKKESRIDFNYTDELWLFGRQILKRWSRDVPVKLGKGVIILEGEFSRSGGSRRFPAIGNVEGIVLEVRDVPKNLVDAAMQKYPNSIKIVQRESLCKKIFENYFAWNSYKL